MKLHVVTVNDYTNYKLWNNLNLNKHILQLMKFVYF